MNRLLACGLLTVLLCGFPAPLAAEDASRHAESRLIGKAVVFEQKGRQVGVRVNVRFATIGRNSYMIASHPSSDAKQWDQWISLDEINEFKVFNTVDEAIGYATEAHPENLHPRAALSEAGPKIEPTVHIDHERIIFDGKEVTLGALRQAISGLPPESRTIRVTGGPGASVQQTQQVTRLINETGRGVLSAVARPEAGLAVLNVPSRPGDENTEGSTTGTVTYRGQPVTGRIFFHTSEGAFFGSLIDDAGHFAFPTPPPGEFKVTIEGPNVPDQHSAQNADLRANITSGSNTINFELSR